MDAYGSPVTCSEKTDIRILSHFNLKVRSNNCPIKYCICGLLSVQKYLTGDTISINWDNPHLQLVRSLRVTPFASEQKTRQLIRNDAFATSSRLRVVIDNGKPELFPEPPSVRYFVVHCSSLGPNLECHIESPLCGRRRLRLELPFSISHRPSPRILHRRELTGMSSD